MYQLRIYGLTDRHDLPLVTHTETMAQAMQIAEIDLPMRLASGIYVRAEIWTCVGSVPVALSLNKTFHSPHTSNTSAET